MSVVLILLVVGIGIFVLRYALEWLFDESTDRIADAIKSRMKPPPDE